MNDSSAFSNLTTLSTLPHLAWPFFAEHHRRLADDAHAWAARHLAQPWTAPSVAETCRSLVRLLGEGGWLRWCVPDAAQSTVNPPAFDARALCLLREILARHSTLADFVFAMQGLGAGPIALFGNAQQQARYLPGVAAGRLIPAFALSEADAGSDVAALACRATRLQNGDWQLDGEKMWISNGGIADFYVVFARTDATQTRGSAGISAFIVEAGSPGMDVGEPINTLSPHPLTRLHFTHCRIPSTQRLGKEGNGFKMAMATLDIFRTSVGAAALGMAQRALYATLEHVQTRTMFGQHLADMQLTQARLAEMTTALDASALLVYRAAWERDQGKKPTREAAMAKLFATEEAQKVIDAAVQLFGGRGVMQGETVEALYRDIRALRIYEGASEVQKLIIARETLRALKEATQSAVEFTNT